MVQEMEDLTLPVSGRDHAQGPATAPVTLVEYGDYECPDCGDAYPIVKELQKRLRNRLRFVFRHFPLMEMHPHAERAAEAAEAAGAQGKFWEMHDLLFEHQQALEDADLRQYAGRIGLDLAKFDDDMKRRAYAGRVKEDLLSGEESEIPGTPTFFINGMLYDDAYDLETLLGAVEAVADGAL